MSVMLFAPRGFIGNREMGSFNADIRMGCALFSITKKEKNMMEYHSVLFHIVLLHLHFFH